MFEFADGFFTDDAPLLLFLPEFKAIRDDVRAYAPSYGFALAKDWWGIHELSLCLPTDTKFIIHSYLNSSICFWTCVDYICCLISGQYSNIEDTTLYIDSTVLAHDVFSIRAFSTICFLQWKWGP